jgi:predicted Zn-dependent protease
VIAALLSACIVNPVTSEGELALVSKTHEIQMGKENYLAMRQMQGGDYVADPALTTYVSEVGQLLATVSDRQLPYEFTVINDSIPNAWALPGGKIAINRGLLIALNNEAELAAVLSHEIVHAAAGHSAQDMERELLLKGAILAPAAIADDSEYAPLTVREGQLAAQLAGQKYSREAEREADLYGMRYMSRAGYDPWAAASLQETFVRLAKKRLKDWLSGLFASHPPSRERVEANRAIARTLPMGGELGVERYQAKIARLKQVKVAYAVYDRGRKALQRGKLQQALAFAEQAIAEEPREALFYGLRGDIRLARERYQEALSDYNKAIERNSRFFYFYNQRGLVKKVLGDLESASRDFQQSLDLLPTVMASKTLGDLALLQGDRQSAVTYYQQAADSQSQLGFEAERALVHLDLPHNPQKYLAVNTELNKRGYLIAEITNQAPVAVRNIGIEVRYPDSQGLIRSHSQQFEGTLAAGQVVRFKTDLRPILDLGTLDQILVIVTQAHIAD